MSEDKPNSIAEKAKQIYANWPIILCICTVIINYKTSEIRGELSLSQAVDPIEKELIIMKNDIRNNASSIEREVHDLDVKADRLEVYIERTFKKKQQE